VPRVAVVTALIPSESSSRAPELDPSKYIFSITYCSPQTTHSIGQPVLTKTEAHSGPRTNYRRYKLERIPSGVLTFLFESHLASGTSGGVRKKS